MRALILLECLVILALAGLILLAPPPEQAAAFGEIFPASALLGDATPGEVATYRIDQGQGTLEFVVGAVDRGGPQGPPKITITRSFKDSVGTVIPEAEPTYVHQLVEHGLFPFLTPAEPKAWDRTWVLRRIRRDEVRFLGRPLKCWRVECIDPALEPEQESVVVWMHEDVPVFGILRFERAGRIYECTSWRPKS
jgi:hypothetical protein